MAVSRGKSTATDPVLMAVIDLALVAVFAALIAVLALAPAIPVGIGVPITLQTLGVALAGLTLGPVRGFLAVVLYIVVGLVGLPVFAGGAAGFVVLSKPAAGYLLSFPFGALVAGAVALALSRRGVSYWKLLVAGICASLIIIHPIGIVGMMVNAHLPLSKAALLDLIYWPGDLVKNLIAASVALAVHKAFPRLFVRRVRREEPARA